MLREVRDELNKTMQELEQKREIVNSVEGTEVLKGEDVRQIYFYGYRFVRLILSFHIITIFLYSNVSVCKLYK